MTTSLFACEYIPNRQEEQNMSWALLPYMLWALLPYYAFSSCFFYYL